MCPGWRHEAIRLSKFIRLAKGTAEYKIPISKQFDSYLFMVSCKAMAASVEGNQPSYQKYLKFGRVSSPEHLQYEVFWRGWFGVACKCCFQTDLVWMLRSHWLEVYWLILFLLVGTSGGTWLSSVLHTWSPRLTSPRTLLLEEKQLWPPCLT